VCAQRVLAVAQPKLQTRPHPISIGGMHSTLVGRFQALQPSWGLVSSTVLLVHSFIVFTRADTQPAVTLAECHFTAGSLAVRPGSCTYMCMYGTQQHLDTVHAR
jgi:hypothetical protein